MIPLLDMEGADTEGTAMLGDYLVSLVPSQGWSDASFWLVWPDWVKSDMQLRMPEGTTLQDIFSQALGSEGMLRDAMTRCHGGASPDARPSFLSRRGFTTSTITALAGEFGMNENWPSLLAVLGEAWAEHHGLSPDDDCEEIEAARQFAVQEWNDLVERVSQSSARAQNGEARPIARGARR